MPYAPDYMGGGQVPASNFGGNSGFFSNFSQNPALASAGAGGIGAGLAGLFAPYNNPAEAASPYLSEMKKTLPQYFQPYMQTGQQALPGLQSAYSQMMDPNAFLQKIGSGYQESPGFKFQRDQALKAMQNSQASGGMLGSPQHELESGQLANNLANQDFYNYLKQALGIYGQGVSGQENLFGKGFEASTGLGRDLASITGSQGGLAYQSAQEQNKRDADTYGAIFGGASSLLPFLFM